ncbi:MAG: translesion DNA synthesis-associated protein ImuA [Burkholderiaceae bacterium]
MSAPQRLLRSVASAADARTDLSAAPPASLPASVWRADQLGQAPVCALSSGDPELDAQLPGAGWPFAMLTELLSREAGIGELRLLVPALRELSRERRRVLLVAPPHLPYAPALAGFGIDPAQWLIVRAPGAADRLWAVEQALRSASFGALLAWLPDEATRADHVRRLQMAAQSARGPVFLFRPSSVRQHPSPAPLRLALSPGADQSVLVEIIKRRGPVLDRPLSIRLPQPAGATRLRRPHGAESDRRSHVDRPDSSIAPVSSDAIDAIDALPR